MSESRRGENSPNYGKHISEEQKEKTRATRRANDILLGRTYKRDPTSIKRGKDCYRAHSVVCLNTGEIFDTIDEAASKYGIMQSSISSCCSNTHRSAGASSDGTPLLWMYKENVSDTSEDALKRLFLDSLKNYNDYIQYDHSKRVRCIDTGEEFRSMTDACKKILLWFKLVERPFKRTGM